MGVDPVARTIVRIFSSWDAALGVKREGPRLGEGSRASLETPASRWATGLTEGLPCYAVNELPQPQPPVEFGFLKVKPEPCMDET